METTPCPDNYQVITPSGFLIFSTNQVLVATEAFHLESYGYYVNKFTLSEGKWTMSEQLFYKDNELIIQSS